MPVVYLGLGSNLGDRAANLWAAVQLMQTRIGARDVRVSGLYETEPVGGVEQPSFLNAAMRAGVEMEPNQLLASLKRIETDLGRLPSERWGPRPIDLDILLFGQIQLETPSLSIPHRELWNRRFALEPLLEVVDDGEFARAVRRAIESLPAVPRVRAYRPIDPVSRGV
jgi:2-amino-4-hydroxy-6-hydroxymethyldihydropteridine diphosphokinase